jgi:hypothetical protein
MLSTAFSKKIAGKADILVDQAEGTESRLKLALTFKPMYEGKPLRYPGSIWEK